MFAETERLQMRQMTSDDVTSLLTVFGDAEAMRFYPAPFDGQQMQEWVDWNQRNYTNYGYGLWALILRATGELVGDCGLVNQQVEDSLEIEIGYHVRRDLWRQGLATEAAIACRDYGFDILGRRRLGGSAFTVNINAKSRNRKQLVWPLTGIVVTILAVQFAATNPFYTPHIALKTGIAAWCAALVLVIILSACRIGARAGVVLAGLFLAIPCFVTSPPLFRGLLMCIMCMPFAAAVALVITPPIATVRARLAYLCSWCGTHQISRCARSLDVASLLHLVVATAVLAISMAVVMAVPDANSWLLLRWLAGGIMILAFAEMVTACFPLVATAFGVIIPPLMQSPYLSTSIGEFWTKRWNIFASEKVFRPYCFTPLARRSVGLALFAGFALSAVGHVLLAYAALGSWSISLIWGTFFLVQPLLIIAERWLAVRRWRPSSARVWTLAALAITSPLFVEPMLRVVEESWGKQDSAFPPTAVILGFVIIFSGVVSFASLTSYSAVTKCSPPNNSPGCVKSFALRPGKMVAE